MRYRTRSRRRPRQNLKPSLSPPVGSGSIFKNKIFKLTILLIYLQYKPTSSVFVVHLIALKNAQNALNNMRASSIINCIVQIHSICRLSRGHISRGHISWGYILKQIHSTCMIRWETEIVSVRIWLLGLKLRRMRGRRGGHAA